MKRLFSTFAVGLTLFAVAPVAHARQNSDYEYPFETVWSAVIRLVRVDLQFSIRDRDEEAGYILFDYKDGGRVVPGSVELVRARGERGPTVRVLVQIPSMPSYIERMIVDRLKKKLVSDYGEPSENMPREDAPKEGDSKSRPREGKGQTGTAAKKAPPPVR